MNVGIIISFGHVCVQLVFDNIVESDRIKLFLWKQVIPGDRSRTWTT